MILDEMRRDGFSTDAIAASFFSAGLLVAKKESFVAYYQHLHWVEEKARELRLHWDDDVGRKYDLAALKNGKVVPLAETVD